MPKITTAPPIYPNLEVGNESNASNVGAGAETVDAGNQDYRMQEISRIRGHLENEIESRRGLYRKYNKAVNALDGVDTTLSAAAMGMGFVSAGLLSTIVATPVAVILSVVAGGCGLSSVIAKIVGKKMRVKARKHDEIRVLAESKLNSITELVSRALTDGHIQTDEFTAVANDLVKYKDMKSRLRNHHKQAYYKITLDEDTNKSLIQKGRDEATANLMEKLRGNSA